VVFHDSADRPFWPSRSLLALNVVGSGLALYVFMADALRVAAKVKRPCATLLPVRFNWPLYALAWVLMATPVVELAVRALRRSREGSVPECRNPGLTPSPRD